jgi:hypothetical protein
MLQNVHLIQVKDEVSLQQRKAHQRMQMRKIIKPMFGELCLKLITLFDLKAFRRMGRLPIISVMPNMKHMQLDFTINKKS